MTKELEWSCEGERMLLKTRVFDVLERRETSSGGVSGDYIALKAPDCVVVVPEYEGRFVLVSQWRHGMGAVTTEFPGGVIDRGEEPEASAYRELLEETGYRAGKLTLLGVCSPNPALFTSRLYFYLAEELSPTGETHPDADEVISVSEVPVNEVIASFGEGRFAHAFTGAALAFYLRHRGK
ncbi:MAG: NUDIX hydrolase [Clostridiales bacterium]|nr:NUDIX hydrolase [Clostridiales bacterium]